ncbi:GrpB family protein [Hoeflea sp. AS60]|uniref:GrpB family protein n=1 Tax=Hoeflea sp. AS60 TaxID=3135780 RepID=UPI003176E326
MTNTRPMLFNEYRTEWPIAFEKEKKALVAEFGDVALEIHHIGSTSVPGMPGKGIIDILVIVSSLMPSEAYDKPLRRLGYINRPVPDRPESPFYTKPSVKPRTHNVHIAVQNGEIARNHIMFRDYLRADRGAFDRYAAYKRGQIETTPDEWDKYSRNKLEVAAQILKEAREKYDG